MPRLVRRVLDGLYLAGGVAAAACLVALLATIAAQMLARWTGEVVAGSPDYAGYFMAAASFLALAYALNAGAHVRVRLLLSGLGRHRRMAEIWCHGVGTVLAAHFAWYAVKANIWSNRLNDVSQGQDATPLWIPQLAMSAGTLILAVAFADQFVRVLLTDHEGVGEAELADETVPVDREP